MRFTQHPSNTRVLSAPDGWDQQAVYCGALPITDTEFEGAPAIMSFWVPDAEELAHLNKGGCVVLIVPGMIMMPAAIAVEKKE